MNKYLRDNISLLKRSFQIDRLWVNLGLEICKYILLAIVLLVLLAFTLKSLYSTMPLLDTVEQIRDVPSDQLTDEMMDDILGKKHLLNKLLINISIILVFFILLSSTISSYFNSLIVSNLRKEKFSSDKFKNLLLVYLLYSVICMLIFLLILIYSHNLLLIFIIMLLLLLKKWHINCIYSSSAMGRSFVRDLKDGLLHMLKIHRSLIPFMLGLIALLLASTIWIYIAGSINAYLVVFEILIIALWNVWMKNYHVIAYDHIRAMHAK